MLALEYCTFDRNTITTTNKLVDVKCYPFSGINIRFVFIALYDKIIIK